MDMQWHKANKIIIILINTYNFSHHNNARTSGLDYSVEETLFSLSSRF